MSKRMTLWLLACAVCMTPAVFGQDFKKSLDRGANWLIENQREDGSYGSYQGDVGITALVVHALATCPRGYREEDGPFISKAVQYILANAQPNGGFYNEGQGLRNYKTSVTILALSALDKDRKDKRYTKHLEKARNYVAGLQCSELSMPHPYDQKEHWRSYGGIGYGSDKRPDLSNTQYALEALVESGLSEDSQVLERVRTFLARCQNFTANDAADGKKMGSTGDGGFMYSPGESKAGKVESGDGVVSHVSYGSMTYAGLKSYIYAGLTLDDPRVAAAWNWVQKHYTVEENPNMATKLDPSRGQMGLFYYYVVLARTMEVLGKDTITTPDGVAHSWPKELGEKLISLQRKDGSWVNPVDRWWEADPAVVTAYAVRALSVAKARAEATKK